MKHHRHHWAACLWSSMLRPAAPSPSCDHVAGLRCRTWIPRMVRQQRWTLCIRPPCNFGHFCPKYSQGLHCPRITRGTDSLYIYFRHSSGGVYFRAWQSPAGVCLPAFDLIQCLCPHRGRADFRHHVCGHACVPQPAMHNLSPVTRRRCACLLLQPQGAGGRDAGPLRQPLGCRQHTGPRN